MADELATVGLYHTGVLQQSLAVTLQGPTITAPTSPALIGNTFSGPDNNAPDGLQVMNAVPGGGCLIGVSWNENTHDGNLVTSAGAIVGPRTCTRNGPGGNGIWGICTDGTYIFYADGQGDLIRSNLADWVAATANDGTFDNGTNSGVGVLTLSANNLMDCVTHGGFVYVLDPAGAIGSSGQVAPTSTKIWKVGSVTAGSWGSAVSLVTVPYARRMAFDRQGNLWVLTQGVSGNPSGSNQLRRYNTSGTLLQSNAVPASVGYAMDIACDPSLDRLYLADNGVDQQIKILSYDTANSSAPAVVGTVGQQAGYLDITNGTKGQLGSFRFCGLRGVALDSSGNMYVAQTGDALQGQANWNIYGKGAIVSKLAAGFASESWRVASGWNLGGVGAVSADFSKAYTYCWRYAKSGSQYAALPEACTLDPAQDWVGRMGTVFGPAMYVREDINPGTRYVLTSPGTYANSLLDISQEQGNILVPRVSFRNTNPGQIVTNNVGADAAFFLTANDAWMDDVGNVWALGSGGQHIWRFRLQGFAGDGTPQYDWAHVDTYSVPASFGGGTTGTLHSIVVHGTNIYISGFNTGDDPVVANLFDGYKIMGRYLSKWTSLPTGPSYVWPAPAWTTTFAYTNPSLSGDNGTFPLTFDVDTVNGLVVVGWFFDPAFNNSGYLGIYRDSAGTLITTLDPPFPEYANGTQSIGSFDMVPRSITCQNGWVWCEDDWAIKSVGRSLAAYKGT